MPLEKIYVEVKCRITTRELPFILLLKPSVQIFGIDLTRALGHVLEVPGI